ncbi:hypothetical protein [Brasilonema sp. UFV-L1]|uniref:hypothetical protein n=2 Tax=Brasilonema sp. UFV-L1 TaxID=2234130 RepID=UPI00145D63AF|nr:hypothetical protein [Brasilonema sp. UFV-L1]NMG11880.1 hypothetical protein [Brasilonema sp. UFV-L1]
MIDMEYAVALDRIKEGLGEKAADVLAAIADKVSTLESDVNLWKRRHTTLEGQLNGLKEQTDGKEPSYALTTLKSENETLKEKVTTLEKELGEAIAKVEEYEKNNLYADIASKAKLNKDALINFIKTGILPNDIKLEGDTVTVGGKKIDEYLAEGGREWIKNALMTGSESYNNKSETGQGNNKPPVPQGGTSGSGSPEGDPIGSVIKSMGFKLPAIIQGNK